MTTDVEFPPFTVDAPEPDPEPRDPSRHAWGWAAAALVAALVVGQAIGAEQEEIAAPTLPTLVEQAEANPADAPLVADFRSTAVADTVVAVVAPPNAAAELVTWHPDRDQPTRLRVPPGTRPDATGNRFGHLTMRPDGTVAVSVVDVDADGRQDGPTIGIDVTSWVWDDTLPAVVVHAESPRSGMTEIVRTNLVGADTTTVSAMQLLGSWEVVASSNGVPVVVEERGALGLVGYPGSFYQRSGEPPIVVTGIVEGVVHAVSGPERVPVPTDLRGTAAPWPAGWWNPALGAAQGSPAGWGMQAGDGVVVLTAPDGSRRVVQATAMGTWSGDGRHAIVPQGSTLLVIDTVSGVHARVATEVPVVAVWTRP